MKTVCKKLLSLMLVAILLVSAVPFQASASANGTITYYCGSDYSSTFAFDYISGEVTLDFVKQNIPAGYTYSEWQFISGEAVGSNTHTPSTSNPAYKCAVTAIPSTPAAPTTPENYQVTFKFMTEDGTIVGTSNVQTVNAATGPFTVSYYTSAPQGYTVVNNVFSVSGTTQAITVGVPVTRDTYAYTIEYIDKDTGSTIGNIYSGTAPTDSTVNVMNYAPNGYSFYAGGVGVTQQEVVIDANNKVIKVVMTKNAVPATVHVSYKILNNNEASKTVTGKNVGDKIQLTYDLIGQNQASFGTGYTEAWVVDGVAYNTNDWVDVVDGMQITFNVYNANTYVITLNPNGGSVSDTSIIGTKNAACPNLPNPTREGYAFRYWYYVNAYGTEIQVVPGTTTFSGNVTLIAKWVAEDITVTFQKYVGGSMDDGWVNVTSVNVPAGSTVNKPDVALFALNGYTIKDGAWEIGTSDNDFYFNSTKVTTDLIVRPRYLNGVSLKSRNGNDINASWPVGAITVEVGEPIGSLPSVAASESNVYAGWVASDNATPVNSDTIYTSVYGDIFYVRWANAATVRLHVYTGGNTKTEYKTIYIQAPTEGRFDLSAVNMHAYIPNYDKYLDDVDNIYGWYTYTEWENFCAGVVPAYRHLFYDDLAARNQYDFYIMLIDNGVGTHYNTNNKTWDSSNPKTGDQIFMAVTVLALSASALAAFYFYSKKRRA